MSPGAMRTCSMPARRKIGQRPSANSTERKSEPSETCGAMRLAAKPRPKWPTNIRPPDENAAEPVQLADLIGLETLRVDAAYMRREFNMTIRSVRDVVPAIETLEGAGFLVHRPFPTSDLDYFDPFLLLDEMGPANLAPGEAKGAPDHPHRGFETVTYLLSGSMEHKDSRGNRGKLTPGDVQWMTAGSGVVHSEMPAASFSQTGGRMHGFQLWVNLPARDKMMAPRYQEIPASRIPVGRTADGTVAVRVIAGKSLGAEAV